jgi:hypothetical protein
MYLYSCILYIVVHCIMYSTQFSYINLHGGRCSRHTVVDQCCQGAENSAAKHKRADIYLVGQKL